MGPHFCDQSAEFRVDPELSHSVVVVRSAFRPHSRGRDGDRVVRRKEKREFAIGFRRMRKLVTAAAFLCCAALVEAQDSKWSVPSVDHELRFPYDHGSHPDFKIEWWYLTGHLFDGEKRFGFQATFFRLGQQPVDVPKDDLFGESQIYMAHMAISDAESKTFWHETRFN